MLDKFLTRSPSIVLAGVLVLVALYKAGVAFEVSAQSPTPAFPLPEPGISPTSFGLPALVTALQLTGNATAIGLVMFALTAGMLFLFAFAILRRDREGGLVVASLVLLGPVGIAAFGNVGRHDWFVIAGSLLFVLLGRRVIWACIAAIVMVLGNPEQAFISLAIMFAVSFISQFHVWRRSSGIALMLAAMINVALVIWVESLGLDSRVSWIDYHLYWGLKNFLLNLPLSIYAAYGAGWFLILILLWRLRGSQRFLGLTFLVIVPLVVTAMTHDQTRVMVGISAVSGVIIYRALARDSVKVLRDTFPNSWQAVLVITLVLLPSIEITNQGVVRPPYLWLFEFFVTRFPPVFTG